VGESRNQRVRLENPLVGTRLQGTVQNPGFEPIFTNLQPDTFHCVPDRSCYTPIRPEIGSRRGQVETRTLADLTVPLLKLDG